MEQVETGDYCFYEARPAHGISTVHSQHVHKLHGLVLGSRVQ